jgi:pseudouridine-5'-phosphate glycosidase
MTEEVRDAVDSGKPVVALESSLIGHGPAYPANVELARSLEARIRLTGAIPATVAILGGRIRIGLSDGELDALGRAKGLLKISRADLAYAVSLHKDGITTVASAVICAHIAKIRVFATGGIGGVHRDVEQTMDISADLEELANTPVAVVCSGAKAILDIPRTLEYLETHGVTVVGYGTDRFPAFWSRDSGVPAPLRLDTPQAVASLIFAKEALGIRGAVLIAHPVPQSHEIPADYLSHNIAAALDNAVRLGIAGKAVTPFLLKYIEEATEGRSASSTTALLHSNVNLAGQIACALATANE